MKKEVFESNVLFIRIIKSIVVVLAFVSVGGFMMCYHWKKIINDLHDKAHKEKRNDIWFARKCISKYLIAVFLSLFNILALLEIYYLISK